jgi:hypothetical protein
MSVAERVAEPKVILLSDHQPNSLRTSVLQSIDSPPRNTNSLWYAVASRKIYPNYAERFVWACLSEKSISNYNWGRAVDYMGFIDEGEKFLAGGYQKYPVWREELKRPGLFSQIKDRLTNWYFIESKRCFDPNWLKPWRDTPKRNINSTSLSSKPILLCQRCS